MFTRALKCIRKLFADAEATFFDKIFLSWNLKVGHSFRAPPKKSNFGIKISRFGRNYIKIEYEELWWHIVKVNLITVFF